MMSRETFGVETILEPRRRTDWTEPHAEGDHVLNCAPAGDDE